MIRAPPDEILASSIGRSDGEMLKNLFQAITSSPGCYERPEWWYRIKMLPRQTSKL